MEPEGSLPRYKRTPSVPILSQSNPFLASPFHFLKFRSNIHLSPFLVSPTKNLQASLLSPIRVTCPAHHFLLYLITPKIFGDQYRKLSSSLCILLHFIVTSSPLGPNIFLSTLFSNTLSLCFSLNVKDQASHPYKTTRKISVLYILIFIFFIANRKPKYSAPK